MHKYAYFHQGWIPSWIIREKHLCLIGCKTRYKQIFLLTIRIVDQMQVIPFTKNNKNINVRDKDFIELVL